MQRSKFACLAVALLGLSTLALAGEKKEAPVISISDLKAAIADGKATVIDVNGTESYNAGHIPTAVNFETAKLDEVLPKDKNALVVAYCGGPQCQAYKAAAEKAIAMGYTNVKHLKAGISGWKSAGEKTEKAS